MAEPNQQTTQTTNPSLTPNNFAASLPEEFRNHPSAAKFKDLGGLFKSYTELESTMGRSLRMPGDDAKPEEWNEFYTKIGRPESPDKYGVKRPEMPEGVTWPEDVEKGFLNTAHQLGLNPKQAQGLMDWFGSQTKGTVEAGMQGRAAAQDALKQEWGADFDKNVKLAQRAFGELTDGDKDPIIEYMKESGAHEDPRVLKFFAKLGKLLDEDSAVTGNTTSSASDKDSAMSKIAEIRNNKQHPYHNPNMAGHKEAVAEMNRLYTMAYPDAQ